MPFLTDDEPAMGHAAIGAMITTDDCRVEQSSGPIPAASHHHWTAQGFARGTREDPTPPTPVRRELQAHQSVTSAADTQVKLHGSYFIRSCSGII